MLRPTLAVRLLSWLCLAFGSPILLLGLLGVLDNPLGGLLLAFFGGAFVFGGLWLPVPLFRFDLRRGRLRWGWAWAPRALPLEEVRGLRLAEGGLHSGGEADDFRTFRLDLLLRGPAHARLSVLDHSDEAALRATASRLAELLQVPLEVALPRVGRARE